MGGWVGGWEGWVGRLCVWRGGGGQDGWVGRYR